MDINITGDPGTGNTFQEINIGTVHNFNPNATTVINYNYGEKLKAAPAPDKVLQDADKEARKAGIMEYVLRLKPHVAKDWKNRYESIWQKILALPEVEEQVYEPGKQKGTTFNRNLVASIIYIMCKQNVLSTDNATELTKALENDKDHSVRSQLHTDLDDKDMERNIIALMQ